MAKGLKRWRKSRLEKYSTEIKRKSSEKYT
jgi:hypothetical protein